MTNEIEKQFFSTFGIKPRIYKTSAMGKSEAMLPSLYPEITDRILLELICLHMRYCFHKLFRSSDVDALKNNVLDDLKVAFCWQLDKDFKNKLYNEVRALFGGNEDEKRERNNTRSY